MAERESFGRYEVKGRLGRGGMGAVYLGRDPRFQRDVAIKVLDSQLSENPHFHERFDREARAIALLEHSAIVPVYDYGDQEGEPYLVFRLMEGGSLAQRIARGPVPVDEVARIIARIAGAMDYAHARGVIHRDIKPGNILFDNLGEAWLTDFGIARMTGEASQLTGTSLVGSPDYMAPEQGEGKPATTASDIYGLACTAYEALSGHPPFSGETAVLTLLKHIKEDAPPLENEAGPLPANVDAAVRRGMAKDPSNRPAQALAFATELAEAAGVPLAPPAGTGPVGAISPAASTGERTEVFGSTIAVPATPAPASHDATRVTDSLSGVSGRRRWPLLAGGVVLVAIVAAAVGAMLLLGGGDDDGGDAPFPIPAGKFLQVSAGGSHACAVDPAGSVRCWGDNSRGQASPPAGKYREVSAGSVHSCAIREDQAVVCWGSNDDGRSTAPAGQFLHVSAGSNHTCGVRADARIACWGADVGSPPEGLFDVVAAGLGLNCGITTRGNVSCWGAAATSLGRPNAVEFQRVAVGATHGCSISRAGTLGCVGGNTAGQTDSPAGTYKEVSGGRTHSCAIRGDDTVVCWGTNAATSRPPAPPQGTFFSLSTHAGGGRTCALRTGSGEIVCWD